LVAPARAIGFPCRRLHILRRDRSAPDGGGTMSPQSPSLIQTTLAPWLSVRGSLRALEFYKSAFGSVEVYRMDGGGGVVARLSIDGAEFWLADESPEHFNFSPETTGGSTTRLILTVADPDAT